MLKPPMCDTIGGFFIGIGGIQGFHFPLAKLFCSTSSESNWIIKRYFRFLSLDKRIQTVSFPLYIYCYDPIHSFRNYVPALFA